MAAGISSVRNGIDGLNAPSGRALLPP